MQRWVTRGCLLVNSLIVAIFIFSCYLSLPDRSADNFLPPPAAFFAVGAMFVFLLTTGFYAVWTTFVDKARPQRRPETRKSQFVFTKDGEIMELIEDEKRKRDEL